MTDQERIRALVDLGYTEREAAFLVIAALHSGYFLRRQFLYFTGVQSGKIDQTFLERSIEKQHCKPYGFRHDRIVYHLGSKPLFDKLGAVDNRNRRRHDVTTIQVRLMALDYVLQRLHEFPDDRYFPTESDKLEFFKRELVLPADCLPTKRYSSPTMGPTERYFVDKFPLYVPADDRESVRFCYVDPGLATISAFEHHISQYRSLWSQLRRFSLVYISTGTINSDRARRVFERWTANGCAESVSRTLPENLVAHFKKRLIFEAGDRIGWTQSMLIEFRSELRAYRRFEKVYQDWAASRREPLPTADPATSHDRQGFRQALFFAYELRFDYRLFGNRLHPQIQAETV